LFHFTPHRTDEFIDNDLDLNQVVLLAIGAWSIVTLLMPAIIIFFALKNVSKMT